MRQNICVAMNYEGLTLRAVVIFAANLTIQPAGCTNDRRSLVEIITGDKERDRFGRERGRWRERMNESI